MRDQVDEPDAPDTDRLSAELLDELAEGNRRKIIDPSTVPVRFSWLSRFARSAMHAFEAAQDQRDQTLSMRLGSGTHAIVFDTPYVVWPGDRRQKGYKEWARSQRDDAALLTAKEYERARLIAGAVQRHPIAQSLLFAPGVVHEQTISFDLDGRRCRATPDTYHASERYLVEFKTTKDAQPDRFARDAMYRGYHAQLSWYADGLRAAGLADPVEHYIVAVESTPPHAVTVFKLTARAVAMGYRMHRLWWERLRVCEQSNAWPAYVESIVDFDVPDHDDGFALIIGGEESEVA